MLTVLSQDLQESAIQEELDLDQLDRGVWVVSAEEEGREWAAGQGWVAAVDADIETEKE